MTEPLTKRQDEALQELNRYYRAFGYFPTYTELADALGCSKQAAHRLVSDVESKGYLKTYAGKHRAIRISA